MVLLSDLAKGRDNNFNLIRMLAALSVLVSHAYPIALGADAEQPLKAWTGHTLGDLAVAVFFVISGFLIADSFARARSWQEFLAARVLRLWPGLLLSLAVVALLMGPTVTTLASGAYFSRPEIWTFFTRNTLLAVPQYTLPGVFESQPYPTVEGSIWTLFYEVLCYLGILLAGLTGLLARRRAMSALIGVFVITWLANAVFHPELHLKIRSLLSLGLPFATGTAIWLWRDRLPLSLIGVAALWILTVALAATPAYVPVMTAALAYSTFWLAYVPGGWIRAYNWIGDYSYGVYIYAFPAQGLAIWLAGPVTPLQNMALALPLMLLPAVLSWHLIEKPALAQRRRISAWVAAARLRGAQEPTRAPPPGPRY